MRSDKEFIEEYKSVLTRHGKADWTRKSEPHVPFVDMCLMFLHDYLRGGPADAVPLLMAGYPSLLKGIAEPGFERALKTVRHLCYGFGSRQVWLQAMREYREADQRYRCFEIQQTASGVSYTPGKHTPPGLTGFIRNNWARRRRTRTTPWIGLSPVMPAICGAGRKIQTTGFIHCPRTCRRRPGTDRTAER